jgi:hypothetical protein
MVDREYSIYNNPKNRKTVKRERKITRPSFNRKEIRIMKLLLKEAYYKFIKLHIKKLKKHIYVATYVLDK